MTGPEGLPRLTQRQLEERIDLMEQQLPKRRRRPPRHHRANTDGSDLVLFVASLGIAFGIFMAATEMEAAEAFRALTGAEPADYALPTTEVLDVPDHL